jgi:hypothetical protein
VADISPATFSSFSPKEIWGTELVGTLTPPEGKTYDVTCNFTGGNGFIWLDDHLICQGGNDPTTWSAYRPQNSIPFIHAQGVTMNRTLFFRMTFAHNPVTEGNTTQPSVTMSWTEQSNATIPPKYIGCYKDDTNSKRDLPVNAGDIPGSDSPAACGEKCAAYEYFGLQDGDNCFCGNSYGSQGKAGAESECNMPCPGNKSVMCGAAQRNSIYQHKPSSLIVPASVFGSAVPTAQAQRLSMQRALLHNQWSTWGKGSVTAHTLLPQGTMIKMGVCTAKSPTEDTSADAATM